MSYYVIIRGAAGTGKSTIADRLAKRLKGYHISFDQVMRKNELDKAEGPSIPEKNFVKANELVIPDATKKLDEGKIVIFDGNFYHMSQIEHLIKNLPYPHHEFTLKAPIEECISRDSGRKGFSKIGPESVRVVYTLVAKFDYGTVVDVSGKSVGEIVKEIQSGLP